MDILLTNDDGIGAPGICALYKEIKKIATVTVVAPDSERSSVGHGITLSHPIFQQKIYQGKTFFGYGIKGTPADCVKFAMSVVLKKKPDLVISGINHGGNEGCSVFYSGTIAGAREAALFGIPSMAISLDTFVDPDFGYAAKVGAKLAKAILKYNLPKHTLLNVNVPPVGSSKIKGFRFTRQGRDPILGLFSKRLDPNLRDYYWMTGKMPKVGDDDTIDSNALKHNYVTITPIHCDMTDYATLKKMENWKI